MSWKNAIRTQGPVFVKEASRFGTAMLRLLPAEFAHELTVSALSKGWLEWLPCPRMEEFVSGLRMKVPGIGELNHPIGLAAGMDKNARAIPAFAKMGFSFLEVGTVTPRPQPGNPKPRVFRQPDQMALINRMGFNSDGSQTVGSRLQKLGWQHDSVPLGINIGKNKLTADHNASDDYIQGFYDLQAHGKYYVMNISSPNTAGLRDLASRDFLALLAERLEGNLHRVWIKLDPDLQKKHFQDVVGLVEEFGFQGLILTNTHRVVRPEIGGQSGHPLAAMASARLEWAYEVHQGRLPMIASGGIISGADILQRILRGAAAVQIYTALVYRGPWVVASLLSELMDEMNLIKAPDLSELVGAYYKGGV